MQGQVARTSGDSPTIDEIEGIVAQAIGTHELESLCLCHIRRWWPDSAGKVRKALSSLGCDPDAVAEKVKKVHGDIPQFVISDEGFGPHCCSVRLIALGAYALLQAPAQASL